MTICSANNVISIRDFHLKKHTFDLIKNDLQLVKGALNDEDNKALERLFEIDKKIEDLSEKIDCEGLVLTDSNGYKIANPALEERNNLSAEHLNICDSLNLFRNKI